MEGGGLLHPKNNTNGFVRGNPRGEKNYKMSVMGSVIGRKRLSDITNTTTLPGPVKSDVDEQENPKIVLLASNKDYIAQLLKENTALMRLLGERNKIIEMSSVQLQKLRFALQKTQQQNWQLAQANSQMLAELNLGKDRLKALQHELGCTVAVLRAKNLELEEKKKLNEQLCEKICIEEESTNCARVVEEAASSPASNKKPCVPNRKRTLRNQSLGSIAIVTHQVETKENDDCIRKSLRRRSSNIVTHQVETKEKDDCIRKSLRRRSSNLNSELCEPKEDLFEIEDVKFPIRSLITDPMHEDPVPLDSSAPSSSNTITKPAKAEVHEDHTETDTPQYQKQELGRSSIGRPMRRAAEKVNSYKEVPLNVKMRRAD